MKTHHLETTTIAANRNETGRSADALGGAMFTAEGEGEYRKWEKWIGDENFQLSPTFVPTEEAPAGAVECYKDTYSSFFPVIDFDSPSFRWPVGIGINL